MPSYPNGPAWTISTMGLLWLLYPKLQAWLRRPLQARPFALAAGAAIACQLPMVLAFFAGCVAPGLGKPYFVSEAASLVGYHFPPLRLADFVLGMALAQALADGRAAPERRAWAWLADGAAFAVWAVCACVPWDARSEPFPTSGYEPLFIGGMQPLIGASKAPPRRGAALTLRAHAARGWAMGGGCAASGAPCRPSTHGARSRGHRARSGAPCSPTCPSTTARRPGHPARPGHALFRRPLHFRVFVPGRRAVGVGRHLPPSCPAGAGRVFVPSLFMALANWPHFQGAFDAPSRQPSARNPRAAATRAAARARVLCARQPLPMPADTQPISPGRARPPHG